MNQVIKTVFLDDDRLFIIDQRALPQQEKVIELRNESEVFEAIYTLAVRGAPAIGITAAYGAYISLRKYSASGELGEFKRKGFGILDLIGKSRPTAFNLFYALGRLKGLLEKGVSKDEVLALWKKEAISMHEEDLAKSEGMAL